MLLVINLILGIGLLLSGRKLFWLFIAAAGFFAGVEMTARFWHGPEWISIIVGVAVGVIFALLALGLKSIAISIAGFFLGGSTILWLASGFGIERGIFVLYMIGGVLGVIFISAFFDWALITLSSLAGASIIAQTLDINRPAASLVFILLLLLGIAVQSNALKRDRKNDDG